MRVITVMAHGFKGYFVHSLASATIAQSYGSTSSSRRGRERKKERRSSFYSQKHSHRDDDDKETMSVSAYTGHS